MTTSIKEITAALETLNVEIEEICTDCSETTIWANDYTFGVCVNTEENTAVVVNSEFQEENRWGNIDGRDIKRIVEHYAGD